MTTCTALIRIGCSQVRNLVWLTGMLCSASAISTQPLFDENPAPGSVDSSFTGRINGWVQTILVQPDGRVLVGGDFRGTNLVRLTRDGAPDRTFTPTLGVPRQATRLALQPEGKILVGNKGGLWRLFPDGSYDPTFQFRLPTNFINNGIWSGFWTTALAMQPDGKILLAGHYERDHSDYSYWSAATLQWLQPDGSHGEFFNYNPDYIGVIVLLSDQRLLVAGDRLARLNADGTEDTGFVKTIIARPGVSPTFGIECCITQPDGRILIGGNFTNIQGHARCRVARIMPDGQLDLSFNPPASKREGNPIPDYTAVQALALQADSRILVGGNFETVDGLPYAALARLNPDGSLDTSFPPSVQRDEEADYAMVSAIVIQDGDRALIGGANMVTPNGFDAGDLLRIHLGEPVPPRLSILQAPSGMLQLTYSYSGSAEFAVLTTTNIALPASNWTVLGSATNAGGNLYRLSDQLSPSESHRFYRLRGATPR